MLECNLVFQKPGPIYGLTIHCLNVPTWLPGCENPLNEQIPLRLWRFFLTFTFTFLQGRVMADAANKYPENVEGKFYVDDQCIDCDLCRETAPANFKRNDDGGHSYVYKQAETPEEEALCKEAMEGCPVEAIGNDGA
jgi:ferredoxin